MAREPSTEGTPESGIRENVKWSKTPRMSWKPQIDEMATKGIRKLALAGTRWGANSKIIKTVYTGAGDQH